VIRKHEEHKYYEQKGGYGAPLLLLLHPYVVGRGCILVIALHGIEYSKVVVDKPESRQ
jgi:hypothetical protein